MSATPTNSKPQRRTLKFDSLDDILADAERVSRGSMEVLGNWSAGQIFMHLARGLDMAIDGGPPAPWYARLVGQYLLKKRFLSQTMSAGWKVPAEGLLPGATETEAGLNALRGAIQRMKSTQERKPHPVFGPLNVEEWNLLQCHHAELHLSFLVPAEERKLAESPSG